MSIHVIKDCPKGDRVDNGKIMFTSRPALPSDVAIRNAKLQADKNIRKKNVHAVCALCKTDYRSEIETAHILICGLCNGCHRYWNGERDFIVLFRDPTIQEVFERVKLDVGLTALETRIMVAHYQGVISQISANI